MNSGKRSSAQDTAVLVLTAILVMLISAWVVMYAARTLHTEAPAVPPLSYWASLWTVFAVRAALPPKIQRRKP